MSDNFLTGIKEGQKAFGETIAVIINSVLLLLVYVLGVGLTSLCSKLFNKHFLEMELDQNKTSYWAELNLTKKPMEDYYRQF